MPNTNNGKHTVIKKYTQHKYIIGKGYFCVSAEFWWLGLVQAHRATVMRDDDSGDDEKSKGPGV